MTPSNPKAGRRRLVDMSAPSEAPWAPELPPVEDWGQRFVIGENAAYLVRFGFDERGRLADWAVVQTRRADDGVWRRVAQYDICHRKGLHVHLFNEWEEEFTQVTIRPVQSYRESDEALDYAIDRVARCWQDNERRSDRGR